MTSNTTKQTIYKVCGEHDLEQETSAGWKIHEVIKFRDDEIGMHYASSGDTVGVSLTKENLAFVLKNTLDAVDIKSELDTQKYYAQRSESKAEKLEEENEGLKEKINKLEDAMRLRANEYYKELDELRESKSSMEEDIGKLREQLGAERFDQLLRRESE